MDLAESLAYAKSGFDLLRSAIGLAKDVQGVLPAGEKKDAMGNALIRAERQMQLPEAQITQSLGYKLCRCDYPPAPMLFVGYRIDGFGRRADVFECPTCKNNDAKLEAWERTTGPQAGQKMPRRQPDVGPKRIRPPSSLSEQQFSF